MNPQYYLTDPARVYSPGLLFYADLINHNIQHALEIAGNPGRLRPHVKTHKTREIIFKMLKAGIQKHKCATLAEAEMLATCGVRDIFLAYNMVGPNMLRLSRLIKFYPECHFSITGDNLVALGQLSDLLSRQALEVDVLLDLDVGQHRTGVVPGDEALQLYEKMSRFPGIRPGGFHVYDGHNHMESAAEREAAVRSLFASVLELRAKAEKKGLPAPRIVAGGTPTFPIYAKMEVPGLECAPGTCFLHDHNYGSKFKDMAGFTAAALVLTRVVSKPSPTRLTLDLGTKSIASDPPAGKRCTLLNLTQYEPILQNEEHFVIESPLATNIRPGDVLYAMPAHICPTCALHRQAYVVEKGHVIGCWDIVARDRVLSI